VSFSRFDLDSIFYKEFDFNWIFIFFFAPIFSIEDINSSALSVIGFAEI